MYYLSDLISRAVVLDINPDFMTYFGVWETSYSACMVKWRFSLFSFQSIGCLLILITAKWSYRHFLRKDQLNL